MEQKCHFFFLPAPDRRGTFDFVFRCFRKPTSFQMLNFFYPKPDRYPTASSDQRNRLVPIFPVVVCRCLSNFFFALNVLQLRCHLGCHFVISDRSHQTCCTLALAFIFAWPYLKNFSKIPNLPQLLQPLVGCSTTPWMVFFVSKVTRLFISEGIFCLLQVSGLSLINFSMPGGSTPPELTGLDQIDWRTGKKMRKVEDRVGPANRQTGQYAYAGND